MAGHATQQVAVGEAGTESYIWYKLAFECHCSPTPVFNQSVRFIIKGTHEIYY